MARNLRPNTQTVIVAVDEPEPVAEMLQLADLISAGDQPRIITLTVTLGAVEDQEEAIGKIEAHVAAQAEQGVPVKSLVVSATSVARGILDAAREYGADLILLGLSRDPAQRSGVGSIAENVAATSPCPVVIYRPGPVHITHVAITCDIADLSRAALHLGTRIAEHIEQPVQLITVGEAQSGGATRRYLRRRLEALGVDVDLPRTHIDAHDPVKAIFQRIDQHTLLVTGYEHADLPEPSWFYGSVAKALLRNADGPVALVIRKHSEGDPPRRQKVILRRFLRWFRPTLTPVEQRELLGRAEQMSRTSLDYNVLVVIAALLATFGLLANSNAVIIGAMLVAPLMSPLIAFAAAITAGRISLGGKALLTLLEGFLVAFVVAWLIGMLSPDIIVTSELAARGNPTLIDLGVALAAGVIAAYAQARKDIPAALAGVAIAAALMPPICTVALAVAINNEALYQGALLLFIINISAIMFAAGSTFLYLGVRPRPVETARTRRVGSAIGIGMFGIILALLVTVSINPISNTRIESELRRAFPDSELVEIDLRRSDPLRVIATLRRDKSRPLSDAEVAVARSQLEQQLNRPLVLDVVVQSVVRSAP